MFPVQKIVLSTSKEKCGRSIRSYLPSQNVPSQPCFALHCCNAWPRISSSSEDSGRGARNPHNIRSNPPSYSHRWEGEAIVLLSNALWTGEMWTVKFYKLNADRKSYFRFLVFWSINVLAQTGATYYWPHIVPSGTLDGK
jgi:hypothetical protein